MTNERVKGKKSIHPFEIDIHVVFYKQGTHHLWLECKNLKRKIKRNDVFVLEAKNNDIGSFWTSVFDCLGIVSTTDFDSDALSIAKAKNIACIYYEKGRYRIRNKPWWMP